MTNLRDESSGRVAVFIDAGTRAELNVFKANLSAALRRSVSQDDAIRVLLNHCPDNVASLVETEESTPQLV